MPQSTSITTDDRKQRTAARRGRGQRNLVIGFAILCTLALAVFVVRSNSRSTTTALGRADATNVDLVAQGRQIYATRCASCHGSDLGGEQGWPQRRANGVMPAAPLDERGQVWQRDDRWIFTTIKQGGQATPPAGTISYMPAFGSGLMDDQIWAIISYIKSTWPADLQNAQPSQ